MVDRRWSASPRGAGKVVESLIVGVGLAWHLNLARKQRRQPTTWFSIPRESFPHHVLPALGQLTSPGRTDGQGVDTIAIEIVPLATNMLAFALSSRMSRQI